MKTEIRSVNNKVRSFIMAGMICMLMMTLYFAAPYAFANAKDVITGIVDIVAMICNVVGVLFVLVGVVKFAISHANEDGPAQQKAALMIATGIILVVLGATKIFGIDFASWITTSAS